jgi:hypothetical protein
LPGLLLLLLLPFADGKRRPWSEGVKRVYIFMYSTHTHVTDVDIFIYCI